MAYMDQTKKAVIAAELKKVMPASWKYSLRVHHHSSLTLTIREAPVDLIGLHKWREKWTDNYIQLNEYYLKDQYDGEVLKVMLAIREALNTGNWDKSDSMTDYFNVGFYAYMHIGAWDKPFKFVPPANAPTYDELKAKIAALESRVA